MVIQRGQYIKELLSKRWNGKVKIVTGIRRSGKSFLLSVLYKEFLLKEGVAEDCFVELSLDKKAHIRYRNPEARYTIMCSAGTQDENRRY